MADLELTFVSSPWDRITPLLTGEVKPEGITLKYTRISTQEIWHRQLQNSEFDLSEMSFSFTLQAIPLGWDYRVLPIFHNRAFSYTSTLVRLGSGIRIGHPEDLKGKRVGVVDYQMTGALWARGILRHEFGVDPRGIEWFQGRPDPVIPNATEPFKPAEGVHIHQPPNELESMMVNGELDAMYNVFPPARGPLTDKSKFSLLFESDQAEAERYFTKTHMLPAHHATIVRKSILDKHPWVAKSLLDAFTEAQRIVMERAYQEPPSLLVFSRQALRHQREVFGDNPYAYGVKANAEVVGMAQTFAVEDNTTPKKLPFNDLFAEGILDS